jgi:Tfp pilus assembly protein PilX
MRGHETGAALVISLLLLMVSTVLGVSGMSSAWIGERATGNHRQLSEAHLAAEAGIAHAVAWWEAATDHHSDEGGYWILPHDDAASIERKVSAMVAAIAATDGGMRNGASWTIEDLALADRDTIRFTSTGTVGATGTTRRIAVRYTRPRPFAPGIPVAEAAYTCFGPDCRIVLNGSAFIDGHDWDVPASFDCTGAGCAGVRRDAATHPGVAGVLLPDAGSLTSGGGQGNAQHGVAGNPASSITAAYDGAHGLPYWTGYLARLDAAAARGDLAAGALGTRLMPRVTEITADTRLNGSVSGAGVLIVRENATLGLNGSFHFEGLIVVEAGATIRMGNGNATVFGAIVALGGAPERIDAELTGNIAVKYSRSALTNLAAIPTRPVPGAVSGWQEL